MRLCTLIAENAGVNKMDASNLARSIANGLLRNPAEGTVMPVDLLLFKLGFAESTATTCHANNSWLVLISVVCVFFLLSYDWREIDHFG